MIYYFLLYAKTLAGELNPDLKANLNEQTIINTTYNNRSTEYYKTDISKYQDSFRESIFESCLSCSFLVWAQNLSSIQYGL